MALERRLADDGPGGRSMYRIAAELAESLFDMRKLTLIYYYTNCIKHL
jgi:hypothetical protein